MIYKIFFYRSSCGTGNIGTGFNFFFNTEGFAEYERQFFEKVGIMHGSIQHIDQADQDVLKIDLMSDEALKTS